MARQWFGLNQRMVLKVRFIAKLGLAQRLMIWLGWVRIKARFGTLLKVEGRVCIRPTAGACISDLYPLKTDRQNAKPGL